MTFTHDTEVPWILPGAAPTGRPGIAVVAVVSFDGRLISGEHIYWGQASVPTRTGLVEPAAMTRLPVVTDQRATLTGAPSTISWHPLIKALLSDPWVIGLRVDGRVGGGGGRRG
ncbi:hypothetical protein [Streptomyces sp. NPDC057580]|uniref:hypothetical protein n=1 Tax=Streptomyces sp. NPDC057580 TaxID=3346173 RepID=UPI0036CCB86F